jgi:hypothetical protein
LFDSFHLLQTVCELVYIFKWMKIERAKEKRIGSQYNMRYLWLKSNIYLLILQFYYHHRSINSFFVMSRFCMFVVYVSISFTVIDRRLFVWFDLISTISVVVAGHDTPIWIFFSVSQQIFNYTKNSFMCMNKNPFLFLIWSQW